LQTQRDIATAKRRSETARWRQNQRKPDGFATSGQLPVARGKRRKTEADEIHLSMEVVPVRRTARSSRTASHSELGATSMCGPLRRDPQAGASRRRDRHDSGSVSEGKTDRITHHSHSGGVKPLGARTFISGWMAVAGPKKHSAVVRQGPRRERTRHGCSRLKQ